MIARLDVKWALTFLFAALGPLGHLLVPPSFPSSFRAYYFLLPCFPVFFFLVKERLAKIGAFLLPLFIYCFVSAMIVAQFGSPNEPHTALRFFLFFCQFFFILGAASHLREKKQLTVLLKTYLFAYFISLAIGYFCFLGYYLKIISLATVAHFNVLTQFGFGLLRFSPGSYPNEYGIVSSFVLSILVCAFLENRNDFSKKGFLFLFSTAFVALLLTTTRAAYLSFAIAILYIAWKEGRFFKITVLLALFILLVFSLLLLVKIDLFHILATGFSQRLDQGSLGERYLMWLQATEKVEKYSFWGAGFASLTNLHNVYLQLFFELGFVGMILLLGGLFFSLLGPRLRSRVDKDTCFLHKIRTLGLIHVLFFAVSNHNLNHHLTWFVCFLCFASLRHPFLAAEEEL